MRQMRLLLPLTAALALSGCLSFGKDPPDTLMTLTSAASRPAAASRTGPASQAVTVALPTVPQELATTRVPVRTGDTALAYLKDAQWVEMPSALFSRLLSETIAATTGRVVLDPRQFSFDPGVKLTASCRASASMPIRWRR